MNKKFIIISLLFVGLLFVNAPTKAQTQSPLPELPNAGLTPNSPFYFLERATEAIGEFLTFNTEARARLQVTRAFERVAETKAMLAEEEIKLRGLNIGFSRLQGHMKRATEIIQRMKEQGIDIKALAAELDTGFGFANQHLENVFEESKERLERAAELAKQALEQRFADPAFAQAVEDAFLKIAAAIDTELGQPRDGFVFIEDEANFDMDDDTFSATHQLESPQLVDLTVLRDRILARGVENRWESGDVVLDDDSLDITFEKTYGPIDIMGEKLFAEASVTISATINSPETGMTEINYDIDITLENEHRRLFNILGGLKEEMDDYFNNLSDLLEEQMDIREAALKLIREIEAEKQKLINEAVEEGVELPANFFAELNNLLAQAQSAFQAGSYEEAQQLAKQAEVTLESINETIDNLKEEKELKEEAKKVIQEAEKELTKKQAEVQKEGIIIPAEVLRRFNSSLSRAKTALTAGNYENAKRLAKQAKGVLDDIKEAREKPQEERKTQEETIKEQEVIKEQEEQIQDLTEEGVQE